MLQIVLEDEQQGEQELQELERGMWTARHKQEAEMFMPQGLLEEGWHQEECFFHDSY